MKKTLAALIITLFFARPLFSQTMQHIDQIEKRKMIVVVEEADPETIEKCQKAGVDIVRLKSAIETYNQNMKAVADKFWDYKANGVEYKKYAELGNVNGSYMVLRCQTVESGMHGTRTYSKLDWHSEEMKKYINSEGDVESSTVLTICISEDMKGAPIFAMPVPDLVPSKADLIYAINSINSLPKMEEYKKNNPDKKSGSLKEYKELAKSLKDKTLLLREDWLAKGMTKDKISKAYPYKFDIVSNDKLDIIMMEKTPGYAYVALIGFSATTGANIYTQTVMDCETNAAFAVSAPKGLDSNKYINERNLKDYANGH